MPASSLLLAWLACICTSLACADVVAGTSFAAAEAEAKAAEVPLPPPRSSPPPPKCLDTCVTAADAICQSGGWGPSGVWRELGTDCTCTTRCGNMLSPHFGVDFLFELRGRAWTREVGCKCHVWTPAEGCKYKIPAEECGRTQVPLTRYTVGFPVAGTIDLTASKRGTIDSRLWDGVRAGLQSYLQCFRPDCWVYIGLTRGGMNIEAAVADYSGNGSSTATLERAAALSQENGAAALFASLPEALFKALGPVTVSAPSMDMSIAEVHYIDGKTPDDGYTVSGQRRIWEDRSYYEEPYGEDDSTDDDVVRAQDTVKHNRYIVEHNRNAPYTVSPLTPPPPTAPPSEPEAKAAWPDVETIIFGGCDDCNGYGPEEEQSDDWFKALLSGLACPLSLGLSLAFVVLRMMHYYKCKNKLRPPGPAKVEVAIDNVVFDIVKQELYV